MLAAARNLCANFEIRGGRDIRNITVTITITITSTIITIIIVITILCGILVSTLRLGELGRDIGNAKDIEMRVHTSGNHHKCVPDFFLEPVILSLQSLTVVNRDECFSHAGPGPVQSLITISSISSGSISSISSIRRISSSISSIISISSISSIVSFKGPCPLAMPMILQELL